MNYELAKQLKEAGFPQVMKEGKWYKIQKGHRYVNELYYPTLSELINEIGEDFFRLERTDDIENRWVVKTKYYMNEETGVFENQLAFDKTPKETVAKLYLKLKKK